MKHLNIALFFRHMVVSLLSCSSVFLWHFQCIYQGSFYCHSTTQHVNCSTYMLHKKNKVFMLEC